MSARPAKKKQNTVVSLRKAGETFSAIGQTLGMSRQAAHSLFRAAIKRRELVIEPFSEARAVRRAAMARQIRENVRSGATLTAASKLAGVSRVTGWKLMREFPVSPVAQP